jgi:hypothetical protein
VNINVVEPVHVVFLAILRAELGLILSLTAIDRWPLQRLFPVNFNGGGYVFSFSTDGHRRS